MNRTRNTGSRRRRPAAAALGTLVLTAITNTHAHAGTAPTPVGSPPAVCQSAHPVLMGARATGRTFARVNARIGPVAVTRLFYSGALPARYARQGIPAGVKLIVSYKTPSPATASYARSVPAGDDVELVFHHEPEGPRDFPGVPAEAGARFVSVFDAQSAVIRAANPQVRVGFIGGGYQYQGGAGGSRGLGGHFIPDTAADYYLDSYQRSALHPAASDPAVDHFVRDLTAVGKPFGGFTEYGRGVTHPRQTHPDAQLDRARSRVITTDAHYLNELAAREPSTQVVWVYWYSGDRSSGRHWAFTDATSISSWTAAETAARAAAAPVNCDPTPNPPPTPTPTPTPSPTLPPVTWPPCEPGPVQPWIMCPLVPGPEPVTGPVIGDR